MSGSRTGQTRYRRAISFLVRCAIIGLLSFGFLYSNYKSYVPWESGGIDYAKYYHMVEHPLDFEAAGAPFVYRQFGTLVAWVPWRLGLHFPLEIALDDHLEFRGERYPDTRIFFALLLSNYLFLVLVAVAVGYLLRVVTGREDPVAELLAGLMVFFSFSTLPHVLTGITDGATWFLATAAFLAYFARRLVLVVGILMLSIWQREVLPLVVGTVAAADALFFRRRDRFVGVVFGAAVVAFLAYLLVRVVWLPAPGYPSQLQPSALLSQLFDPSRYLSRSFLLETAMTQNLLALMLVGLWTRYRRGTTGDEVWRLGMLVLAGEATLLVASQAAGANTGRILSMLHPEACVVITASLQAFAREARIGNAAPD